MTPYKLEINISGVPQETPPNLYLIRNWTKTEVDDQLSNYQFNSKPEVRQRFTAKSLTSGTHRTNVYGWESFFLSINYGDQARYNYITADWTFCFNGKDFPIGMESVNTCGNVVLVERIENNWAKIVTMPTNPIPNPLVVNYRLTPWFVHHLQIVNRDYERVESPKKDVYYPVILDTNKEAWMPIDWLVKL